MKNLAAIYFCFLVLLGCEGKSTENRILGVWESVSQKGKKGIGGNNVLTFYEGGVGTSDILEYQNGITHRTPFTYEVIDGQTISRKFSKFELVDEKGVVVGGWTLPESEYVEYEILELSENTLRYIPTSEFSIVKEKVKLNFQFVFKRVNEEK